MNKITWAQTDWHVWTTSIAGYPPMKSGDYWPEPGFSYQFNQQNHDRFSMLKDVGVNQLVKSVRTGAKLMRWHLQHFTDRHINELLELLRLGALAEPDPSSIELVMIAYRHWQQFDNPQIAEALVLHLLRTKYNHAEVMDELYSEQSMRGMSRDESFSSFVGDCKTVLQHERFLQQLKSKGASETRKVKI